MYAGAKKARKPLPGWKPVEMPLGTDYLWDWWLEMNQSRTGTGFGANPIVFTELSAWAGLVGVTLSPFELTILRSLDAEFLAWMAAVSAAKSNKGSKGPQQGRRPLGAMPPRR